MWIVPLLAALISLFFALKFTSKFMNKRNASSLLYAIAMYMYALGAFANFYGAAFEWHDWTFKLFYGPGVALVGYLAAATVYVNTNKIVSHLFTAYVVVTTILMLIQLIPAQVDQAVLFNAGFDVDPKAMPDSVRAYSFPLSGVGGIVLMLGSIWSWWKSRLQGFVWILVGTLVMTIMGRLADIYSFLVPFKELIGLIIFFYGVSILDKKKYLLPRKAKTATSNESESA